MNFIKGIWLLILLALGFGTSSRITKTVIKDRIPHWRFSDGTLLPMIVGGAGPEMMLETLKFAKGLDPVADAFDNATSPVSDVYSLRGHGRILFAIYIGAGATGTQTLTVEACDNVTPSNTTTIPFWYRQILTGDTESAITRAAAAGFTVTAGASKLILIEVDAADVAAASVNSLTGNEFVRLAQSAEPVNSPCLGSIMAILGGAPNRYAEDVNATVIV